MSDKTDNPLPESANTNPMSEIIPSPSASAVNSEYDDIPVEELIKLTRELTLRITNADRQRLALELKESGHQRTIQTRGPIELQQFFRGEIDLDTELAKRFSHAPLLSELSVQKPSIQRRASAIIASQDNSALLTFDLHLQTGMLELVFTLYSMLSLRFKLSDLSRGERQRWIDLMRRNSGIAFLWTKKRWESDYIIFVVRENFARVYAFSPQRFEAAVRITPDALNHLLNWLENLWFSDDSLHTPLLSTSEMAVVDTSDNDDSDHNPTSRPLPDSAELLEDEFIASDDDSDDSSAFEW